MNRLRTSIFSLVLGLTGIGGGFYLSNSQTKNISNDSLVQNTKNGSNSLGHSSVQNVTYNINHNHYYETEHKNR